MRNKGGKTRKEKEISDQEKKQKFQSRKKKNGEVADH